MNLKTKIKSSSLLKKLALWALMPAGQSRPRLWVQWLVNPWVFRRGRGSCIRPRTRLDLFPYHAFVLGDHSTVEDFCTLNNAVGDIAIGNRTRIGIGSVLIGPVTVGDDVRIAQHVAVTALNHRYDDVTVPISQQGVTTELVVIGDETWIGSNAVILPGVHIGRHCVVAAGSVVTRSLPDYTVAAGNPARIIKQYNASTGVWERCR